MFIRHDACSIRCGRPIAELSEQRKNKEKICSGYSFHTVVNQMLGDIFTSAEFTVFAMKRTSNVEVYKASYKIAGSTSAVKTLC